MLSASRMLTSNLPAGSLTSETALSLSDSEDEDGEGKPNVYVYSNVGFLPERTFQHVHMLVPLHHEPTCAPYSASRELRS